MGWRWPKRAEPFGRRPRRAKICAMDESRQNFGNHLLIALPALRDSQFERSVTLICQHDADGAMGVIVNRPSDYTVGEVLQQRGVARDNDA